MREGCPPWLPLAVAFLGFGMLGCAREAKSTRMLVDANPVRVEVEGKGTVRSSSLDIECTSDGGTCRGENFDYAWSELTAEPEPGWRFAGWREQRAPGDRWAPCGPSYRATFVKSGDPAAERVISKRTH